LVAPLPVVRWQSEGIYGWNKILVAAAGRIYASAAPMLLTRGYGWESVLARLVDVFRIGVRGQAFRDFLEAGRKQGKS